MYAAADRIEENCLPNRRSLGPLCRSSSTPMYLRLRLIVGWIGIATFFQHGVMHLVDSSGKQANVLITRAVDLRGS